jgi:hypothetical protein
LLNAPIIIFHLLPVPFRERPGYQTFLKVLFLVINIPLIALNLVTTWAICFHSF